MNPDRKQLEELARKQLEELAQTWRIEDCEVRRVDLPDPLLGDPLVMVIRVPSASSKEVVRTTVEAIGGEVLR
jgi:hypothetical protein